MPVRPRPPRPSSAPHLDHLFADAHQLVVQLGVAHLHLLQPEDALVAALAQLLLLLLQTLDHLRGRAQVRPRPPGLGGRRLTWALPKATLGQRRLMSDLQGSNSSGSRRMSSDCRTSEGRAGERPALMLS